MKDSSKATSVQSRNTFQQDLLHETDMQASTDEICAVLSKRMVSFATLQLLDETPEEEVEAWYNSKA